jgi:23S rRNA (cytidine2498-2'-O)-methyltransferase
MMQANEFEFVFALTNPGSEKALKLEVEMMDLGWRSGYQRRGFVTFKADVPFSLESLEVPLACARRLCLSLGKTATREAALQLLDEVLCASAMPCPSDVATAPIVQHARYFDRKMQAVHQESSVGRPAIGQLVGTVVELGPAEYWVGVHRHAQWLSPDPAGDAGLIMPLESPSRAWLKLEAAARFFDLKFSPGDIVVELGCAPGGVVLALLERGVSVIGVDPANMAAIIQSAAIEERTAAPTDRSWFFHCRKPAALTSKRDLGHGVTWFMSDMNQSPAVVLTECARFCKMAPSIRGVLITLKLTDTAQVADKARWFASLAAMGFTTLRLQQLSVHHKEFALLAIR